MHVSQVATVPTDSTEKVLAKDRLGTNDTDDHHTGGLVERSRRLTIVIDLRENLCSLVEVFPAVEERRVGVENRIVIVFIH